MNPPFMACWALLLTTCLLLTTGCQAPTEPAVLRVGLLIDPLTANDRPSLNAARLAIEEVQAIGGLDVDGKRHSVELLVEDDVTTPGGAVEAARRLIHHRHVAVLVGPTVSREAIPVAVAAENSQIPMISPGSTHPETTAGREYAFRVAFVDDFQGEVLARLAAGELGARKAAVLYDVADAYSRGLAEVFRRDFEAAGGEISGFESYTTGDDDWSAQLRRIGAGGPEVLFLPNYDPDTASQARQARRLGIRAMFLGSDSWNSQLLARIPEMEGAFFSQHWHVDFALMNENARAFVDAYRTAYGEDPSSTAALTYDAFGLLFAAARSEGVAPDEIRRGLARIEDFPGVTGKITYGGRGGSPTKPVTILKIQQGAAVLYQQIFPGSDSLRVDG